MEEEADESAYWLELLVARVWCLRRVQDLLREASELVAIFVASGQTVERGRSGAEINEPIRNPNSAIRNRRNVMEVGTIRQINIENEMQASYLDYAMSVIVARALPDVRDGLKPVHRRILYAMYDLGLTSDKPYKKSARIVGEVLGKYHPHGDAAVYDAMVRMAQDFSCATRWSTARATSARSTATRRRPCAIPRPAWRPSPTRCWRISTRIPLTWTDNFDGTLSEPSVLPAALAQPAGQRLQRALPWAWPPISRRTTWARCAMPCVTSLTTPSTSMK